MLVRKPLQGLWLRILILSAGFILFAGVWSLVQGESCHPEDALCLDIQARENRIKEGQAILELMEKRSKLGAMRRDLEEVRQNMRQNMLDSQVDVYWAKVNKIGVFAGNLTKTLCSGVSTFGPAAAKTHGEVCKETLALSHYATSTLLALKQGKKVDALIDGVKAAEAGSSRFGGYKPPISLGDVISAERNLLEGDYVDAAIDTCKSGMLGQANEKGCSLGNDLGETLLDIKEFHELGKEQEGREHNMRGQIDRGASQIEQVKKKEDAIDQEIQRRLDAFRESPKESETENVREMHESTTDSPSPPQEVETDQNAGMNSDQPIPDIEEDHAQGSQDRFVDIPGDPNYGPYDEDDPEVQQEYSEKPEDPMTNSGSGTSVSLAEHTVCENIGDSCITGDEMVIRLSGCGADYPPAPENCHCNTTCQVGESGQIEPDLMDQLAGDDGGDDSFDMASLMGGTDEELDQIIENPTPQGYDPTLGMGEEGEGGASNSLAMLRALRSGIQGGGVARSQLGGASRRCPNSVPIPSQVAAIIRRKGTPVPPMPSVDSMIEQAGGIEIAASQLKAQISAYRDQLKSMPSGTEEYILVKGTMAHNQAILNAVECRRGNKPGFSTPSLPVLRSPSAPRKITPQPPPKKRNPGSNYPPCTVNCSN